MNTQIYGTDEEYEALLPSRGRDAPCGELVLAMDVSRQTAGCGPVLEQAAAALLASLQKMDRPLRFTYIKYRSGEVISRPWLRSVAVGGVGPQQLRESRRAGLADPAGAVRACLQYLQAEPRCAAPRRVLCLLSGGNASVCRNAAAQNALLAAVRETRALAEASAGRFVFTAAVAEPEDACGHGVRRLLPFAADERNVWSLPDPAESARIESYADWVTGLLFGESVTPVELELDRYFHAGA